MGSIHVYPLRSHKSLQVTDASTYSYFGMSRQASAFEVPEEKVDFYLP